MKINRASGAGMELSKQELQQIKQQAKQEFKEEKMRAEIEKVKQKLREKKPFWQKIFPFKIVIVRR